MLFLASSSQAQDLKVTATVNKTQAGVGEPVTLTVNVETKKDGNVSQPRLPDLKGFNLTQKWNSLQTRTLFTQGQLEHLRTQSFHYRLEPQVKGSLKIDAVTVVINGQEVKTDPIVIQITEKSQGKKSQGQNPFSQDPFFSDMDDMFQSFFQKPFGSPQGQQGSGENIDENNSFSVHLEVDKTEVYEGEQVTASWYLYTPHQIRNIDTLKYPSLKGFWKEDIHLATQLNFKAEIVNGQQYRKALLASYALFPIKAGVSEIDPYKVRCTVIPAHSFMGLGRGQGYTKSSRPIQIKVKPLPSDNVPSDFSGAVGQFRMEAKVGKTDVKVNEPFSLKLRISGKGNAKSVKLPQLSIPSHLELYSTKDESKFFKNGTSFKEFDLLLIPRKMGRVEIPSLSVSSFDPQLKKYVSLSTKPIVLEVLANENDEPITNYPLADAQKKETEERTLPPISAQWETAKSVGLGKRLILWGIVYFILVLGILWRAKTIGLLGGHRKRTLYREYHVKYMELKKHLLSENYKKLGVEAINVINFTIGNLIDEVSADVQIDRLLEQMPPSLRHRLGSELSDVVSYFEALGFAPKAEEQRQRKQAEIYLKKLDTLLQDAIKLSGRGQG